MPGFRLSLQVYLERFDDDGLLLVADHDRVLTVNAAAAELFIAATRAFGDRCFTLEQGCGWLAGQYDLTSQECRAKARALLAFGLKYGLVCRAGEERRCDG